LKVLFLSFFDPFLVETGVGAHIRGLTQALDKLGCEVHILVLTSNGRCRVENKLKVYGFSRFLDYFLHLPVVNGHILPLASTGLVNRMCKEYGIDIVHGQSPSSWAYSLLRECGTPFVVTLHSTSFGEFNSYLDMPISHVNRGVVIGALSEIFSALLTRIEYAYADKVVAVSKAIAEDAIRYFRLPRERVTVIHNGIDLKSLVNFGFSNDEVREHVILSVGRLVWRKGFRFLIDAMPHILSEYSDAKLFLVGDGDQRRILEQRVKKLGIDHSVYFLGRVSKERLYSLYKTADAYVQPSLYEPCAITILEAMSMGKPIVATSVGGNPELITNLAEGLLVEPKNSLQLADAIIRLLSDSSLKRKLGVNARKKVEKDFTWEAIANKTLKIYSSLLDNK
jgi:glycosyltransferase involved in cell wall biosynthesis